MASRPTRQLTPDAYAAVGRHSRTGICHWIRQGFWRSAEWRATTDESAFVRFEKCPAGSMPRLANPIILA